MYPSTNNENSDINNEIEYTVVHAKDSNIPGDNHDTVEIQNESKPSLTIRL